MYVDPYERLLHKPVERKPAPAPMVPYARVGRHPPSVHAEPPKRRPGKRAGKEVWPRIAELYRLHPNAPLSYIARRVRMHPSSVHYALTTMGIYTRRYSEEITARQLAARNAGKTSRKKEQRARAAQMRAEGKSWIWTAKLDGERVRAIRHMHAEGVSVLAICYKFNVADTCIRNIIARKTWKSVP